MFFFCLIKHLTFLAFLEDHNRKNRRAPGLLKIGQRFNNTFANLLFLDLERKKSSVTILLCQKVDLDCSLFIHHHFWNNSYDLKYFKVKVLHEREKWYKIWYQMVLGTILMVILRSFGTKVFKKDVFEYGFLFRL